MNYKNVIFEWNIPLKFKLELYIYLLFYYDFSLAVYFVNCVFSALPMKELQAASVCWIWCTSKILSVCSAFSSFYSVLLCVEWRSGKFWIIIIIARTFGLRIRTNTLHLVFERSLLCSPRLHLFDQKYSNIVKYTVYIYIFKCFCDDKAEFSASLLQSSVSHDSSEIILICWFAAQETFLIIINVVLCLIFFVETDALFFRILWWIWSKKKLQHDLFETLTVEPFVTIQNVFTVSFDQFNVFNVFNLKYSFLFLFFNLLTPNIWLVVIYFPKW